MDETPMEENPSLKPTIRVFEYLFSKLNDRFFNGCLVPPIIVISPEGKANANGWCTSWKAWKTTDGQNQFTNRVLTDHSDTVGISSTRGTSNVQQASEQGLNDEGYYEINLSAEYLNNHIDVIVATLLHEMVHLYNLQEGIKDNSRSGYYHNKNFKDSAEAHGLTVEKDEKSGYSKTSLSDEAVEFVSSLTEIQFDLFRTGDKREIAKSPKTTVHRYVCPTCGNIVRATKVVRVGCLDCNLEMLEQVDEEIREIKKLMVEEGKPLSSTLK